MQTRKVVARPGSRSEAAIVVGNAYLEKTRFHCQQA
jgi:hypothetical protein